MCLYSNVLVQHTEYMSPKRVHSRSRNFQSNQYQCSGVRAWDLRYVATRGYAGYISGHHSRRRIWIMRMMVYRGCLANIPGLNYVDRSYLPVTRVTPMPSKPFVEGLMFPAMRRRGYVYEYSHETFPCVRLRSPFPAHMYCFPCDDYSLCERLTDLGLGSAERLTHATKL